MVCIFNTGQENLKELVGDLISLLLTSMTEDSWPVASVLTKNYFEETMPMFWNKLVDQHLPLSPGSLKFAETYSSAMIENKPEYVDWWHRMIENDLQQASTHEPSVRAAACDCFASISKDIFEGLEVIVDIEKITPY